MSEIKIFRVNMKFRKRHQAYIVSKDYRALKDADALELAYSEVTSRGLKRRQVELLSIEEIPVEKTNDYVIQALDEMN